MYELMTASLSPSVYTPKLQNNHGSKLNGRIKCIQYTQHLLTEVLRPSQPSEVMLSSLGAVLSGSALFAYAMLSDS